MREMSGSIATRAARTAGLGILLLGIALPGAPAARGAESDPPVDPGLIGENGRAVARRTLDPGDEAALIDKPRIAEETAERLRGLRESGNPHIRRGLLISGIQDDSQKGPVDMEKLHQEAVRRIEGPAVDEDGLPGGALTAPRTAAGAPVCPKSHVSEVVGITAALIFLAGMAFHFSYRRFRGEKRPKEVES